ncbi:MAG: Gfo/Idh/MocA family protein [Clostridium sp.]
MSISPKIIRNAGQRKTGCSSYLLPHYLHLEAATECTKRGINILCEKPSNMNGEQLRQMQKLEDQYHVKLAICFQTFKSAFVKLQEMIGSIEYGALGIKAVAIWSRDMNVSGVTVESQYGEAGGGCMINRAIHTLDQMQLRGGPIKILPSDFNLLHHEIEVEDTAVAHIEFEMVLRVHFRNRYL